MAGKITDMTDGSALAATDRFEITRNPTVTPLTRWIDGADVTLRVVTDFPAANLTTKGKVELATIAEVNTGTDATRAVTPDSLEGSALQIKVDGIEALADVTDATNVVAAGAFLVADLATSTEVNIGTDATLAVTPDSLEGSALQIKVNGIEALADVTDATNVAEAGAVMDGDTASLTSKGSVELATTSEMDIGTDIGRAMNVNEFSASDFGTKELWIEAFSSVSDVVTGNGTSGIPIPASMDGYNVVDVLCTVHTKGITGATSVVVRKRSGGVDSDVLSTAVTIGDEFFASDGTIDTGEDDVATGDQLYIDVDAVHTTKPKGLSVVVMLRKP